MCPVSTHATTMVDGLLVDFQRSTLQSSTVEVGALAECGCVSRVWIQYSLPLEVTGPRLTPTLTHHTNPCALHAKRVSRKRRSRTPSSAPSIGEVVNGKTGLRSTVQDVLLDWSTLSS